MSKLITHLKKNLTLSEISGSLGDLGTFLPLLLGLVQTIGLDLGTTLITTGIFNIITGIQFNIPMPVQPMKTIAAEALSSNSLSIEELVSAGLFVSIIVFILGITGLMNTFNNVVPFCLVRGIQLGVGLQLASRGLKMVLFYGDADNDWREWHGIDGLSIGLIGITFVLLTIIPNNANTQNQIIKSQNENNSIEMRDLEEISSLTKNKEEKPKENWKIPAALILVIFGTILVLIFQNSVIKSLKLGPSKIKIIIPNINQIRSGIIKAGLPQLPLTTLNSVVAISQLSKDLFSEEKSVRPNEIAISVGLMNIIGSWFGTMPVCHGAGGLAAQYKFGARNGISIIFLGTIKILFGCLFGNSLFYLMKTFPGPLLGAMLSFAGIELASCCTKGIHNDKDAFLMLLTAAAKFATSDTGIGFGIGTCAFIFLKLQDFSIAFFDRKKT